MSLPTNVFDYGTPQGLSRRSPRPVNTTRNPTTSDLGYDVGTIWVNSSTNNTWIFAGNSAGLAQWAAANGGSSNVNTINSLTPSAGNITIQGTGSQIAVANAGSTITLSLPTPLVTPGAMTVTGLLTASAGISLTGGLTVDSLTVSGLSTLSGGITASGGALALNSGTNAAGFSTDASATTVSIATGAAAKTVTVGSTNSTSALTLQAGTGNVTISGATTTTYTIGTSTGTGTISVGISTAAETVSIMSASTITGSQILNLAAGATPAASSTVNIISGAASAGTQTVNILTGTSTGGTQVFNLATGSSPASINIGNSAAGAITVRGSSAGGMSFVGNGGTIGLFNDAAANLVTLGSTTGAASLALQCGTGNMTLGGVAASTITIGIAGQTGAINLGTSTGALTVGLLNGVAASAQTLNIASGTSATGAQVVNILNGTTPGASTTLNIMNGAATAGTQAVAILSTGATRAGTYNIGDGAAAHVGVIGSTTASAALTLQAGSGTTGLKFNAAGNVQMVPATNSAAGVAVTVNGRVFQATFTGQTTASGASQVFTITNSAITGTTQAILVSADNLGANDAQMTITRVLQSANTLAITLKNNGAAALNGDVHITGWILN